MTTTASTTQSTAESVAEQLAQHGIEFGQKYVDPASGFEGEVQGLFFYKHGCLRVQLRGRNFQTGEPAEYVFDAPELVAVATDEPVPAGARRGGPHDLAPPAR